MNMKKIFLTLGLCFSIIAFSQDVNVLMKEAENLERSLKEEQAFEKYKQVLNLEPANVRALIRSAELSCNIGARQADKKVKRGYYDIGKDYADKALALDSNNADANYVRSVVAGRLTDVESENKKIIEHVRDSKEYADRALALNANHGKANYAVGKWHFEMINIGWAKRAAVKVFFGGLPTATIEDAIMYMEKSRKLEPYYVLNFLDLAKAYKYDNKPAKAIEVLQQLVKLPTRSPDDAGYKAEGKKMLEELM
jgi:hypothetical protein